MIDIHAHILPGMDDGAEDTQETLEMARMAVSSGVTAMVATPHCNFPDVYDNYYDEYYMETFRRIKTSLKEAEIPLQLYAGMEVLVTPDVPKLITDGKLISMNGGRYMLVEFAFDEELDYVNHMLEQIAELRIVPVIAHPERYQFLQDYPQAASKWKQKGYVLQANKGSFTGRFGRHASRLAYELLDNQLLSVIASDCHGPYQRTPFMLDAYEKLSKSYSEKQLKKLFKDNPMRICLNQPVLE